SGAPAGGRSSGPAPAAAVEPGSGEAEDLLKDPDCRFSDVARQDLERGIVDDYLISALQAVCREHSIYVNVFKTGHTFGPGMPEGPTIPAGYGEAGGYPNTHYFGRAADVWEVDGKPVEGNGDDPDVVSVGRMLAGLPEKNSPDVVIGPGAWNRALGYGAEQGWVTATDQVALHEDHLHIGYWEGDGTLPPNLSTPTKKIPPHDTYPYTNGETVQNSGSETSRDSGQAGRSGDKPGADPKETIEPAKNPSSAAPKPRPPRDAEGRDRENPAPRKPEAQDPGDKPKAPDTPRKPQDREPAPEPTPKPDPKPDPKPKPPVKEEPQPGDAPPAEDQYADSDEDQAEARDETGSGEAASGETTDKDAGPEN
ncbi:MAG: hypothetical protein WA990_15230, partial [Rubrobacteraceae bacterium]